MAVDRTSHPASGVSAQSSLDPACRRTIFSGVEMRYKLLGRSGLQVSELCLGTMMFSDETRDHYADMIETSPRQAETSSTPPTSTRTAPASGSPGR
jgi:hypothetical protein